MLGVDVVPVDVPVVLDAVVEPVDVGLLASPLVVVVVDVLVLDDGFSAGIGGRSGLHAMSAIATMRKIEVFFIVLVRERTGPNSFRKQQSYRCKQVWCRSDQGPRRALVL